MKLQEGGSIRAGGNIRLFCFRHGYTGATWKAKILGKKKGNPLTLRIAFVFW
jgi:hypothetical protein